MRGLQYNKIKDHLMGLNNHLKTMSSPSNRILTVAPDK